MHCSESERADWELYQCILIPLLLLFLLMSGEGAGGEGGVRSGGGDREGEGKRGTRGAVVGGCLCVYYIHK